MRVRMHAFTYKAQRTCTHAVSTAYLQGGHACVRIRLAPGTMRSRSGAQAEGAGPPPSLLSREVWPPAWVG